MKCKTISSLDSVDIRCVADATKWHSSTVTVHILTYCLALRARQSLRQRVMRRSGTLIAYRRGQRKPASKVLITRRSFLRRKVRKTSVVWLERYQSAAKSLLWVLPRRVLSDSKRILVSLRLCHTALCFDACICGLLRSLPNEIHLRSYSMKILCFSSSAFKLTNPPIMSCKTCKQYLAGLRETLCCYKMSTSCYITDYREH